MNFPAAVIAAMALCNQHVIATRGASSFLTFSSSGVVVCSNGFSTYSGGLTGCTPPTKEQQKKEEDERTAAVFRDGFAWEPEFQEKCLKIHSYIDKIRSDEEKAEDARKAAEKQAAKKAEQPTLDKGIAALSAITE